MPTFSTATRYGFLLGGLLVGLGLLLRGPSALGVFLALCGTHALWLAIVALVRGPYPWLVAGLAVGAVALAQYGVVLLLSRTSYPGGWPLIGLLAGAVVTVVLAQVGLRRYPELGRSMGETAREGSVLDLLVGRQIPKAASSSHKV